MPSHPLRRAAAFTATAAALCALTATSVTAASAAIVPAPVTSSAEAAPFTLTPIGTHETGIFDGSAAEIVHAHGNRLFVVNALAGSVTVLDYSDPTDLTQLYEISAEGTANSLAVRDDGLGVIAFEAAEKTAPGRLVFFDADAAEPSILGSVSVGALPDMVTISDDGTYAVVANEGEPADDFSSDPEGSIGVVTLPSAKAAPAQDAVRIADFHAFEEGGSKSLDPEVRVFGPTPETDFPVSRNLEPEFVAVDGGTAYAALQEANAIAVVDLDSATVTDILPLGYKDHGVAGNGLDASDRDDAIDIATYPGLFGLYMPDGIASYTADGQTYLVTANEGDAREWGDFIDEARVKNLGKDGLAPVCAGSPLAGLRGDADLGRLNVVTDLGIAEGGDCYSALYAYGARSFSIWTSEGEQVFDSGDDFERITAAAVPENFNSDHGESDFDGRSDAKGPEPESLAIGQVGERTYAFVGLERVGGVMVYDITDPAASDFVTYVNNRDFSVSGEDDLAAAGDLGAEGLEFIAAEDSPTGEPLLAVANEVSGTTTVFAIDDGVTEIDVLTVNDFHGRIEPGSGSDGVVGAAVLAGAVRAHEAANPNTLFVSAGDNIGASTFTSFIQDDEPTIDALVAAGLDVSAVGNHEFDRGLDDLVERVLPRFGGAADFGLGANVYLKGTDEPALPEYTVKTVDGVRVAFIGTVTEDTATMVDPAGIAEIEFGDQLEAANRVAAEITAGDLADVTILLTHSGTAVSGDCAAVSGDPSDFGELARGASAEIDAIVSAHTHQTYACEVPVEGADGVTRPVIQAAEYGKALGRLELSVDSETKELLSIDASTITLQGAGYAPDAEVAQIVADAKAVADVEGNQPVGTISGDILRGGTPPGSDRGVESTLGNTIADVYLWATSNESYSGTPAQIALMNPGGLRADLRYGVDGTVTYRAAADVQPFANTLVTVTLTGAQLEEILELQWRAEGERPKLHLGVSEGFTYQYTEAAPMPGETAARSGEIVSMSYEGETIAPTDEFTVVTNSFLANGGDGFSPFAEGTDRTDTGQVDLAATVAYFRAFDVVDPAPLGRAVKAGATPTPSPSPTLPGTGADPGADWADVVLSNGGRVEQGGVLRVTVRGLEPGQRIGATLHSDPIVVQNIPAANAAGETSFSVAIPERLTLGAHTLVLTADGREPMRLPVTVVRPGALAVTGSELPWALALGGGLLVVAGGLAFALRGRRATA